MSVGILGLPIDASLVTVGPAVLTETNAQDALEALAVGAARHQLQLLLTATPSIAGNTDVPIPFDTVLVDTDGYVTIAPTVFPGQIVPAGAAALIPAGLAGDYDLSGEVGATFDSGAAPHPAVFAVNFYLMLNAVNVKASAAAYAPAIPTGANAAQITLLPSLVTLAAGDVIWAMIQNFTDDGGAGWTPIDLVMQLSTRLTLTKR